MGYSNRVGDFLQTVCQEIRWKKVHKIVSEEMENHILDQKEAFMAGGLDEELATRKAIEEMGDPVAIGLELDNTHRPKPEWSMIFLVGLMLGLGFVIRLLTAYEPHVPYLLGKSLITAGIGLGFMIMAYFLDFTIIGRYPKTIFIGLTIFSIGTMMFGPTIYGRHQYIQFILLLYPLAFAGIIYKMRDRGYVGIIISSIFLIIPILMGLMIPSFSVTFLSILSLLTLIGIAIGKGWFNKNKIGRTLWIYVSAILIPAIIFIQSLVTNPYYKHRLAVALNPSSDPLGSGYQTLKVRDMIRNAKLFGRGGLSLNSHLVPNIHTDYTLTYIIHRLGWIAFIILMAIILAFIIRGFMLSFRQKSILGGLVSVAVMITFTMEVVLYSLSNLGFQLIAPFTLPFISYSGMSMIINMILVGILLSVFRTGDIVRDDNIEISGDKIFQMDDGKIIIDLKSR